MKTYTVYIPATVSILIEVDAESTEEAIEKALNSDFTLNLETTEKAELNEWETHRKVVEGNVFYGVLAEVEVETEEDDD